MTKHSIDLRVCELVKVTSWFLIKPKEVTAIVYRYIQEGMYSTAICESIVLLIFAAYSRRIEFLKRYSSRKLFLLDGKIETVEKNLFYFLLFHFLRFHFLRCRLFESM